MEQLLSQKSIMVSSVTESGNPFISYAPFVKLENKLYIYQSQMSEHYHNMIKNPKIAIMFIEDEATTKNIFARARLTFSATATKIDDVSEAVWKAFEQLEGAEIIQMLQKLDFDMFEIELHQGRLIKGFGKAYNIQLKDGEWVQEAIGADTHGHGMRMK